MRKRETAQVNEIKNEKEEVTTHRKTKCHEITTINYAPTN